MKLRFTPREVENIASIAQRREHEDA